MASASDREDGKENLPLGVVFATLAFASLAVMSALAKEADRHAATEVIVLFQNLICLLAIAPFALRHGPGPLSTGRFGLHLLRAATGTGAWLALFYAITMIPLTNAVLLTYSAPLWLPMIAWLLGGQRVSGRIWLGVALGFAGIVLVLHPSSSPLNFGAVLGLLAAVLLALALLSVRWLSTTEPTERILFYYFLLSTLLILPFAAFAWRAPDGWAWLYLVAIGICLLLSQVLIIVAYRHASAVTLAPIIYAVIVFTALINWAVWGRAPTLLEAAGMLVVIAGGVIAVTGGTGGPSPSKQPGAAPIQSSG
jgi:drug/metabolite transporter (DMT)-like permease